VKKLLVFGSVFVLVALAILGSVFYFRGGDGFKFDAADFEALELQSTLISDDPGHLVVFYPEGNLALSQYEGFNDEGNATLHAWVYGLADESIVSWGNGKGFWYAHPQAEFTPRYLVGWYEEAYVLYSSWRPEPCLNKVKAYFAVFEDREGEWVRIRTLTAELEGYRSQTLHFDFPELQELLEEVGAEGDFTYTPTVYLSSWQNVKDPFGDSFTIPYCS